ncbi:MAG: hypothetical protein JWP08_2635 [Bryobacterales bacterium]|nr:hypothetical protein [Bryobacterales bacterium]
MVQPVGSFIGESRFRGSHLTVRPTLELLMVGHLM